MHTGGASYVYSINAFALTVSTYAYVRSQHVFNWLTPSTPFPLHRHPDAHRRPKFSELLTSLKRLSAAELFLWSQEDLDAAGTDLPQATEIGASLERGWRLFKDLQDTYKQETPYS